LVMQVDNGSVAPDDTLFEVVQASLDELARMRELVANGRRVSPARAMIARIHSLTRPKSAQPSSAPKSTPAPAPRAAAPAAIRPSAAPGQAGASPFFSEPAELAPTELDIDLTELGADAPPLTPGESSSTPAFALAAGSPEAAPEAGFGSLTNDSSRWAPPTDESAPAGAAEISADALTPVPPDPESGFEVTEHAAGAEEQPWRTETASPWNSAETNIAEAQPSPEQAWLKDTSSEPWPAELAPEDASELGNASDASEAANATAFLGAEGGDDGVAGEDAFANGRDVGAGEAPSAGTWSGADHGPSSGDFGRGDRGSSLDAFSGADHATSGDFGSGERGPESERFGLVDHGSVSDGFGRADRGSSSDALSAADQPLAGDFAPADHGPDSDRFGGADHGPASDAFSAADAGSGARGFGDTHHGAASDAFSSLEHRADATHFGDADSLRAAAYLQDQGAEPAAGQAADLGASLAGADDAGIIVQEGEPLDAIPAVEPPPSEIERLSATGVSATLTQLESAAAQSAAMPPPMPSASVATPPVAKSVSISFERRSEPRGTEEGLVPPQPVPPGREPVAPVERQEMARVDAELLDNLLNISGEASIARSRLEQQLGSFDFNLGELSRTVTRLKEQLRSLEIETEAQILHRHEDDNGHRSEFDPLELDRYSSIQQFSRALAETANDVASIQQLLENLAKDTQTLLQQQARTITELQNG